MLGQMSPAIQTLPVLILNPYNRCNCRCVMCDIWKRDTVEETSPEQFDRQLIDIERLGVKWVVFTGGEPLMHSGLFRMCAQLRARNIRVTILSSGLLLGRYAARIVEHSDDVIVSLDGPPKIHDRIRRVPGAFDLLAAGVRQIRQGERKFPIASRCTVQSANCAHLVATVAAARELELDSVSFLAADTTSSAFNRPVALSVERECELIPDAEQIFLLDSQIDAIIGADECGRFVQESPDKLRKIAHHFRSRLGITQAVSPVCNAPWTSAVVDADGTVRPCFFHAPIGRIANGTGLTDVLNGPRAIQFRSSLDVATNPVCRQCVCSLNWKSPL
jgi:MoaA/NifB/PqqE/SkfB family radical SAM enzyme